MPALQQRERREVTILLVEDDPGHAALIEKNLRRANITNEIVAVGDGQAALDYFAAPETAGAPLRGEQDASPHTPAVLVLLDLNLPVLDGHQVLRRLKADGRTKRVPVVILTTTDDPREVSQCYDLGCNVFVTKPVDYRHFCDAIRQLGLFLSVVTLPDME